jgi:uncharacterized damage-inducible protein DinB
MAGVRPEPLSAEGLPDLPALRLGFADEGRAWEALLRAMEDADIESEVALESRGRTLQLPRWSVLQHLVLHGRQHHAESAQPLTRLDRPPGNLNFIFCS